MDNCQVYNLYLNDERCVANCGTYNKFAYAGKCLSECPKGKYLYEESGSNKQCIDDCQVYNLYINDKRCVSNCGTYNKFAFAGKCLSECPEGKYLYEDINTYKNQCVDDCRSHNLYINDNKCVSDCKIFSKISFEGKCLSECPDDFPYTSNNICRSDPCEEGKFYDIFNRKCFYKCDSISNYIDTETNYCINSCKSKKSNKIFSIFENQCISNCNEQNKYIYSYNDEYYCIDNCEEKNLLISKDSKFCVEQCDSDAPYINNNKCTYSCDDLFIDSDKKCVEQCPNNLPYIYNSECVDSCYDKNLYNIYNTNICVDSCSNYLVLNNENEPKYYKNNYEKCLEIEGNTEDSCNKPFYLSDNINKICYQDCNQSLNHKFVYNNEECVENCFYGIKEDNICNGGKQNEECEQFKEKSSGIYLYMNYSILLILFFNCF